MESRDTRGNKVVGATLHLLSLWLDVAAIKTSSQKREELYSAGKKVLPEKYGLPAIMQAGDCYSGQGKHTHTLILYLMLLFRILGGYIDLTRETSGCRRHHPANHHRTDFQ